MNAVDAERRRRLEWVTLAKEYAERARQSLDSDQAVSTSESESALGAHANLRDWLHDLERNLTWSRHAVPDLSSTSANFTRIAARLDKIEALFEKIIEQEAARIASRDRFEQTVLAQIGPLRDAVGFLLSHAQHDNPSDVHSRTARAHYENVTGLPKTEARQ